MKEAERKKHLMPEVVWWKVIGGLDEDDIVVTGGGDWDSDGAVLLVHQDDGMGGLNLFPISGDISPGRVLVKNSYGACWTMTVEEFDAEYRGR